MSVKVPNIHTYARRMALEPADIADAIADAFFVEKVDTAEIGERLRLPESLVYNMLHAWREQGVEK